MPAPELPRFRLLRQIFQPRELVIVGVLLLEIAALAVVDAQSSRPTRFVTPRSLMGVALSVYTVGIAALGATVVIISGGIDLSAGAVYGLSAMVMAVLFTQGASLPVALVAGGAAGVLVGAICLAERARWPVAAGAGLLSAVVVAAVAAFGPSSFLIAVAGGLLCGALLGLTSGAVIGYFRIPPFIVTLGMMSVALGAMRLLAGGGYVSITSALEADRASARWARLFNAQLFEIEQRGVPLAFVFLLIAALGLAALLVATRPGRYIHAVGGNERAARYAGIRVTRVKLLAYSVAGLFAAIAGLFYLCQYGSLLPDHGRGAELDIIAAAVIGGVSLSGGRGSPLGAVVGALIVSILDRGLDFYAVPDAIAQIAIGVIIVLAVVVDRVAQWFGARWSARRR